METNARWNFDTDRIGSDRDRTTRTIGGGYSIPVDRSKRAVRSDAIDQSSVQSSTTMRPPHTHTLRLAECVSPLRGANSRRRFAFCSPLREMDRLAEKKLSNIPADPLPFSRSTVSLFLFIYLFIYPFILFIFFFCQTFPLTRPFHFFNERADRWKFSKIHGFLVKRESGFESPRRRRPRSRESSSIRTKNLSLSFSRRTATLSAEREPQNFPSTFSYHSLNALPPFKSRTVKFSPACSSSFPSFSSLRPRGKWRKTRCDAISLEIDLARWLNTL